MEIAFFENSHRKCFFFPKKLDTPEKPGYFAPNILCQILCVKAK
jgi:hypothetical protein